MSFSERFPCAGVTVAPVHGEVDIATADGVRDRLLLATRHRRCDCLVVDMSGVEFFDASGIRALVAVYRVLTGEGRHMVLAEPPAAVDRVLRALDLDEIFDIYPMLEMALAHTEQGRVDTGSLNGGPGAG